MPGTVKDIAQRLNLSVSTVSYALNDGPKPVSAGVRREVLKLAKEIGYRPNRIARSLATGRTRTVGIVPMYVDPDSLLQPFQLLALNGIFNAASRLDQDVIVYTSRDHNRPHVTANDLMDCRADGLVFIAPRPWSEALRCIMESTIPFVSLFEDCGKASFTVDNGVGNRLALDHLFQLGHSRIAHVTGNLALSDGRQRREAFIEYMGGKGIAVPDDYFIEGDFTKESGYAAGVFFSTLSPRPTAVCCGNDGMAMGFVEALEERGIHCPADVSVVCFDCVDVLGNVTPTLTAVQQPIQRMANEAVRELVSQIESGEPIENQVFNPNFVIRGSTASLPSEESFQ